MKILFVVHDIRLEGATLENVLFKNVGKNFQISITSASYLSQSGAIKKRFRKEILREIPNGLIPQDAEKREKYIEDYLTEVPSVFEFPVARVGHSLVFKGQDYFVQYEYSNGDQTIVILDSVVVLSEYKILSRSEILSELDESEAED